MKVEGRQGEKYSWGELQAISRQESDRVAYQAAQRERAQERIAFIDAADCADGRRWRWFASGPSWSESWDDDLSADANADAGIVELRMIAE